MKHSPLFDEFLTNINPSAEATSYAQQAHTRVREYLEADDKFSQYVTGSFLYGSYRRYTAVGEIKDVDIVVLTKFDIDDEENTPSKVLRRLKAALARCYGDAENLEYQRRSIRVDDPLPNHPDVELTLDIIPAVALNGDNNVLWVPDKEQAQWIQSHPKGHLRYVNELNAYDYSSGRFVPLVKIMKWWWKYQCNVRQPKVVRPKPKGFWIECLTAENFDPNQTSYAEHFISTLRSISQTYDDTTDVPALQDPGLPSQNVQTNMDSSEFEEFMTAVDESLALAEEACAEPDSLASSEMWRKIFGEAFPLYDEEESEETRQASKSVLLDDTSHVEPLRWYIDNTKGYKISVNAYIYNGNKTKRLGGLNSEGRVIRSGLSLKFIASTTVPRPYEVCWQVVNTGAHARRENGLRGKIFHSQLVQWEPTAYTGRHWIQCFIVKDGFCVAQSQRFYVTIENPEHPLPRRA